MWVFGYGSLVWNPGFHYDEKVLGFIKGYKRVFDLGKALFLLVFLIDLYFPTIDGSFVFDVIV